MKTVAAPARDVVHGHVSPGFEAVREVFAENFRRRRELGSACCVYHRGERVVDLWGGIRNKQTGEPWEQDTMRCAGAEDPQAAPELLPAQHDRDRCRDL